MAVGIAHAVMSENKDRYGEVGDQLQTGATDDRKGEIRLADWYDRSGGWDEYLECTDGELAANAAARAVKIANSKNYGYSRGGGVKDGRWSGYKAIKSAGFDQGKGNFDCSSLVIASYGSSQRVDAGENCHYDCSPVENCPPSQSDPRGEQRTDRPARHTRGTDGTGWHLSLLYQRA